MSGQVKASTVFKVTLLWPYDIQSIRSKVAAFKELTEEEPVIRLNGNYEATDGELAFLSSTKVHAVGRKYLTIKEVHAGKEFLYQVDPGKPNCCQPFPSEYFVTLALE